ncbi:MAG: YkgJ family cysteine cluster protein [Desulfarculus sp.]|nr:YkgJ family cysteine cluster protein [Desulfarculus sp.]
MSEIKNQLALEDEFTFACHRGLECYTSCCRDVTIFLTPYDVIRMKKGLGLTSGEFLEKYTDLVIMPDKHLPLVQLRMNAEDNLKCHFVRTHGCLVYPHRPWACRMFPLDERFAGGYRIIPSPERCHGLVKGDQWKVREWLMDQGATQSKEMDGSYDSLAAHEFLRQLDITNEQIQQMLLMALWDMDRFRDFVFKTSFLDRFELEPELIEAIKTDDAILLELGYAWVRFGLFGQKSLKLKEGAEQAGKAKK